MQTTFSYEDLVACSEGKIFGEGNAQLPAPGMLMVDRITSINMDGGEFGKGQLTAELDIKPNLWFFNVHFPGDPVMPGCLGLDAMWQLAGFFLAWIGNTGKGRALGSGEVKFTGQILPDNKMVKYVLDFKRIISRKLKLVIADGRVEVDGKTIYTAKDLRVGLFDSTEGF